MLEATEQHGGLTQFVHLTCAREVLAKRVGEDSRPSQGKIIDAELLDQLLETYDLFTPYPARPSLQLDTTDTPPSKTASAIAAHLEHST